MTLADTHAHLDFPEFAADLDAVLARARAAGVRTIIAVGTTVASSRAAVALADRDPDLYAVVGIHPGHAHEAPPDAPGGPDAPGALAALRELARHPKVAAIGETGLDFYRLPGAPLRAAGDAAAADRLDEAYRQGQLAMFRAHLALAAAAGLNVVVHQRAAWEEVRAVLRGGPAGVRAVFHCFSGTPEQAAAVVGDGHLVSFTGIATFTNARAVQAAAAAVPATAYMVETDCPYLAPVPHRGRRCEPAHVRHTAEMIARLRGESLARVAADTTATAHRFFRLGPAMAAGRAAFTPGTIPG